MDDQAIAQRGVHAGMTKAELQRRVSERVEAILNAAIHKHQKGILNGDEAKATIATIYEMRQLLAGVNTDIRQGELARERISNGEGR